MRFVVDMNLSPRWVQALRDAGIEAVHWSEVGAKTAADAEIMRFAREQGDVVLTHDLDFGAILAVTGGAKPSVVQIRADDVSPESIAAPVVGALRQMRAELEAGALLTIEPERTRMRLLPLVRRGG